MYSIHIFHGIDSPKTRINFINDHYYQSLFVNFKIAPQLENDIKQSLTLAINRECSCDFFVEMIDQGEFHCSPGSSIGYRYMVNITCILHTVSSAIYNIIVQ